MLFYVILIFVLRLKSYKIMKHEEVDNPPSVFHHLSSKLIPIINTSTPSFGIVIAHLLW